MNTNRDETLTARWLDDELAGAELAAFEAGPGRDPELQARREEARRWRAWVAATVPVSEEPPYPELFHQRIASAVRHSASHTVPAKRLFASVSWLMPIAVAAGLAFAFLLGMRTGAHRAVAPEVVAAPRAIPVEPFVYTPENGVRAERFLSDSAGATVIVLNGIPAISDSLEFSSATASAMPVDETDARVDAN